MARQAPLTIGIDCDGVLYRFGAVMSRWLQQECGIPAQQLGTPRTYSLPDAWGVSEEFLAREMVRAVRAGVLFWTGAPYTDALPAVRRIAAAGHRIRIITARALPGIEDLCKQATDFWLTQTRFPFDEVILSHDKHEVDFDILFDDCPANVVTSLAAGRQAVLLDRPWNRDATHLPVTTWSGAADLLTGATTAKSLTRRLARAA